jgi:hypothetical protein
MTENSTEHQESTNPPLIIASVSKSALIDVNNLQKYPIKKNRGTAMTFNFYPGHNTTEKLTFFTGKDMIVGIHIKINDKEGGYWNNKMEVLLDAVYNGFYYRLGLEKYKSERSLDLRINNFIKYILADTVL